MSKAVMLSIRPKWVEKIASGEKTIEVRKTWPKLQTPFKCYIYCTKPKYPHDDTDCVLNDINQPFVLGAGDANPETGYPGEYAEKWNRRADNG